MATAGRSDGGEQSSGKFFGMSFPFSCVERPSSVPLVELGEQVFLVYAWTAPAEVLGGAWQCTALSQPHCDAAVLVLLPCSCKKHTSWEFKWLNQMLINQKENGFSNITII